MNLNRIQPKLPVKSYDTYELLRPKQTHMRPASCEEYGCEEYRNGWVTVVNEATALGARQAAYIRSDRTRSHVESRSEKGWTAFRFGAGSKCFREHQVAIEREPVFLIARGDWRQLIGRHQVSGDEWLDRFGENQINLKSMIERG